MRYLIRPLNLKGIDKLVYEAIYEKIYDFEGMEAKYTYRQIAEDIRLEFKLEYNPKQIMKSINGMVESGYLQVLEKGKKGTPTTFKVVKIEDIKGKQIDNKLETNRQQINVEKSTLSDDIETDKQQKGNTKGTPYNKKNNKDIIYIDAFTKIFEVWNNEKIIVHRKINNNMVKAYKKALGTYTDDEIVEAIKNYGEILSSDFYYSYKFSLETFLSQKNGMSRFAKDGDVYVNYLEHKKGPTAIGPGNKKTNYNPSICNNQRNNTQKVIEHKFV